MGDENPPRPAVVVDRTSGDEREGQDANAQAQQTAHRAREAGFDVVAVLADEDVSGDSPWTERPQLRKAMHEAVRLDAVLVVREVSRLSRFRPHEGRALVETIPDLEVLGRPHWSRRAGEWVRDDDSDEGLRLYDLWDAWREKRHTSARTQHAMTEIKGGRRKTKTGAPPGRPAVGIAPEHLDEARRVLETGGLAAAHRRVLELRGYNDAKDERTQEKRFVSRDTLARALGRRARAPASAQNPDARKTQDAPADGSSADNGPVVRDTQPAPETSTQEGRASSPAGQRRPGGTPRTGPVDSNGGRAR